LFVLLRDHKDYQNLEKLLTELQNVASLINERKRQAEQMEKVLLVQEKLSGDFAVCTSVHLVVFLSSPHTSLLPY
jgi:hypothetical protein